MSKLDRYAVFGVMHELSMLGSQISRPELAGRGKLLAKQLNWHAQDDPTEASLVEQNC